MVRIAVLVSGSGTNLQAIIDAEERGEISSGKVSLVISDRDKTKALERAEKAGIETIVVDRNSFNDSSYFAKKLVSILREKEIGLVVLAGFMSILTEEITDAYRMKIINIHPSLIPSFCGKGYYGLKVHREALKYGVKITGATVHFVTEEVDGGPIILQKAVDIPQGIKAEELQKLVMRECEWRILPLAVELFCSGRIQTEGRQVIIKG
jgi:phosphoribosylglycinamide formyltransferase-1